MKKISSMMAMDTDFTAAIQAIRESYVFNEELATGDPGRQVTALSRQYGVSVPAILDRVLPRVIGHRFYTRSAVENSAEAFEQAMLADFDGVECDVLSCKDDLVIFHDPTLKRLCSGDERAIDTVPVSELKQLRVTDDTLNQRVGRKIEGHFLTFDELITRYKQWVVDRPGKQLCLELKEPITENDVHRIVDAVFDQSLHQDVVFFSFDLPMLEWVSRYVDTRRESQPDLPNLNLNYLLSPPASNVAAITEKLPEFESVQANGTYVYALQSNMNTLGTITDFCRSNGIRPMVGHDPRELARGPDGVMAHSLERQLHRIFAQYSEAVVTDHPDLARDVKSRWIDALCHTGGCAS